MNESYRIIALRAERLRAMEQGDLDYADRIQLTIDDLVEEQEMAEFLRNSAPERRQA